MTKRTILFFVIWNLLFEISGAVLADQPLGLFDCYELALKQSEQIQLYQERIHQTEANFQRAFAGVLPRVSYILKETKEDLLGTSPERKLFVEQPIFRGFKEFSSMSVQRAIKEQRVHEKERAEQLLFLDVSDAFYQILELEHDLRILGQMKFVSEKQTRELGQWVRIGRSRSSELAAALSRLKQVEAEITKTRRLLSLSKEVMTFLIGKENFRLSQGKWEWNSTDAVSSLMEGINRRPDVVAKEKQEQAAVSNIKVEKADLFPDVSFEGNSYQERSGAKGKVDWDMLLTVDIPIFEGAEWGDVKESKTLYEQVKLETRQARRQAESELRSAYQQFQHSLSEQKALKEAVEAEQENYDLQEQDYERRLIHQVTLLSSLRDLQELKRQSNHAEFETKRSFWNLKVAGGQVEQQT
ncbi:MAG: TolC family protein [Candidatus Omnitrophica bacterium]|nr:TolC family protein [Candidatus Omnitrophota bacterium]